MDWFIFIVLTVLGVIISGGVLFLKGGPGIVGVCGAVIPFIGVPIALFVFVFPSFKQMFKGLYRSVIPAFIPVLFASMFFGLLMYDQNPKVMFKRLLSDPIPEGISNIRSYDDSAGLDVEYGLAFDATPKAIDFLIQKNGLELVTNDSDFNRFDIPFNHFPEENKNQEWLYYSKDDSEHENAWYMWVNIEKNKVLFKFIGF